VHVKMHVARAKGCAKEDMCWAACWVSLPHVLTVDRWDVVVIPYFHHRIGVTSCTSTVRELSPRLKPRSPLAVIMNFDLASMRIDEMMPS